MGWVVRQFWSVLAWVVVLPVSASAERVTDNEETFEITWPETWDSGAAMTDMVMAWATTDGSGGGHCLAYRREVPSLAAATQQQLNESLSGPLSEDQWSDVIGGGKLRDFTDIRVVQGVLVSQRATATIPVPIPGTKPRTEYATVRIALFAKPGEVFLASCSVGQSTYPDNATLFETILDSFRPL